MNQKNIMVDLETVGKSSNAAIIAIGACYFDFNGTGDRFSAIVDLGSSMSHGLTIDAPAIKWWMKQSDEARSQFNSPAVSTLKSSLRSFAEFCDPDTIVWGNGSDFDNVILANAFRECDLEIPWKFYNNRCFRTLKNSFVVEAPERTGKHSALSDAVWQAEHAVRIFQKFREVLAFA